MFLEELEGKVIFNVGHYENKFILIIEDNIKLEITIDDLWREEPILEYLIERER